MIAYSVRVNKSPVSVNFERDKNDTHLFRYTNSLINSREFGKALRFLKAVLKKNNGNTEMLSDCYFLLGRLYMAQDKMDEAKAFLNTCLSHDPEYFYALASIGEILCNEDRFSEACNYFVACQQLKPNNSDIYRVIGEACMAAGQLEKSTAYFLKALKLNSNNWSAWCDLTSAYHSQGRIDNASECARMYIKEMNLQKVQTRIEATAHGSYCFMRMAGEMNYDKLMDTFKGWAKVYAPEDYIDPYIQNYDLPKRKIRVGYVGSDFRYHAAIRIYEPLFEYCSKDVFEIYAYSSTPKHDKMTDRLQKMFDRWYNVNGYNDDELYNLIVSDQIDILVDLNGHTDRNRLLVFTRKPCPIQVTGFGLISPLNVPQFDYFITDRNVTDSERENVTFEKPLFIPSVMHWKSFEEDGIDFEPDFAYTKQGYITFGTTNNLYKINDRVINIWSSILNKVPESRLIIKAKQMSDELTVEHYVKKKFEKNGIEPYRIITLGQSDHASHVRAMNLIDIALDPFPYQGGVTTCEALYMGIPVISLNQGTRTGATIIKSSGFDTCVETMPEYIDAAVRVAKKMKKGEYMSRNEIRAQFVSSPVCDDRLYCKEVESRFIEAFWAKVNSQE